MSKIVNLKKLFLKDGKESKIPIGKSYRGVLPAEDVRLHHPIVLFTPEGKEVMNTSPVSKITGRNKKYVLLETATSTYILTYL